MRTRQRKQGAGRPSKGTPKFPLQKKKMDEALAYLADQGWTKEALAREVFGVDANTLSSWCTGQVELDLRTKKTFHHDLGVRSDFWTRKDLSLSEAIEHPAEQNFPPLLKSGVEPITLQALIRRLGKVGEEVDEIRDLASRISEEQNPAAPSASSTTTSEKEGKRRDGLPERREREQDP